MSDMAHHAMAIFKLLKLTATLEHVQRATQLRSASGAVYPNNGPKIESSVCRNIGVGVGVGVGVRLGK